MGSRHLMNRALASLAILLCAWLTYPAFHSVHLEGYTAQTQSIALLKSIAPTLEHDPYLPRITQYIYQVRSGVVDILSIVFDIFPRAGDLAFRGLVLSSLALLLISSVIFARRWGGVPALFSLLALILTPGIPETAFFFNDNIVSAAFAAAALAFILNRPSRPAALVSGVCCALAVLSRLDAVFVFPIVLGTVLHAHRERRQRLVILSLMLAGAVAVLATSALTHGFSLLDSLDTASQATGRTDAKRWFFVRIYFFGLAALPFLLVGSWLSYRRLKSESAYIGIATFLVYPALLVFLAPSATEIRYVFPLLAPMIAMHGGAGVQWVRDQYASGTRSKFRWALAITACAGLVMISPPALVAVSDGPHSVLGRLWSPAQWAAWQGSVDQSMYRLKQLVAMLDDDRQNVVISTHFNDEFYLRLRLMEDGFLPLPAASKYPGCNGFSLFTKDHSTVIHVRAHPEYRLAGVTDRYNAALQIATAFSCPPVGSSSRIFVTTYDKDERFLSPEVYGFSAASFPGPATIEFSDAIKRPKLGNRDSGLLMYRELTPQEMSTILSKARQYLDSAPEGGSHPGRGMTIEEYAQVYRPLTGPTTHLLSALKSRY